MRAMIDDDLVLAHRDRALSPDHPVHARHGAEPRRLLPGARSRATRSTLACPAIVQDAMDKFAKSSGRQYHLFDYVGAPDAERVIVMMGSGAEAAHETVESPDRRGEKVGVLKVRLFRPFSMEHFVAALPDHGQEHRRARPHQGAGRHRRAAVPGCGHRARRSVQPAEPIQASRRSSAAATGCRRRNSRRRWSRRVFDELKKPTPKNHFTVGIIDDVTHTSLDFDPAFSTGTAGHGARHVLRPWRRRHGGRQQELHQDHRRRDDELRAGLLRLRLQEVRRVTISHLRFGPQPIRSTYLISAGQLRGLPSVHLPGALRHAEHADAGRHFLLNSPFGAEEVWDKLPREVQEQIIEKKLRFYVIDGVRTWRSDTGMGGRINTIMQTCFFAITACCRGRGHRRDQARHREDLRQAGRSRRRSRTSRPWTPPWTTCTK